MCLVRRKKSNGDIKDWLVTVRRDGIIHQKYFKPECENEAKKYNDELIRKLPPVKRLGPKQGVNRRIPHSSKPFELNGCIISKSFEGDRCDKEGSCEHFVEECLDKVSKLDWPGFTNKRRIKK